MNHASLHNLAQTTCSFIPCHFMHSPNCSVSQNPGFPHAFRPLPVLLSLPGMLFLPLPGQRAPTYPAKPSNMGSPSGKLSRQMPSLPPLSVHPDSLIRLPPALITLYQSISS